MTRSIRGEPATSEPGRRLARVTVLAVLIAALGLTLLLAGRSPAGAQDDGSQDDGSQDDGSQDGGSQDGGARTELVARGRQLYLVGCVSCHGTDATGVRTSDGSERGPTLVDAGEASAYYYLSTGRMPLGNPKEESLRKDPAYPPDEQAALVAYVASLGDGPELPDIDLADADLAAGGLVYRGNCQACHSASGGGGALSYGRAAPGLSKSEPAQVAAAVRAGPGQMPVFANAAISDAQLDDLTSYVEYLEAPEDPGGIPMGRIGPVPEGFVAWFVGVTLLLACVFWIGTRSPIRGRSRT